MPENISAYSIASWGRYPPAHAAALCRQAQATSDNSPQKTRTAPPYGPAPPMLRLPLPRKCHDTSIVATEAKPVKIPWGYMPRRWRLRLFPPRIRRSRARMAPAIPPIRSSDRFAPLPWGMVAAELRLGALLAVFATDESLPPVRNLPFTAPHPEKGG